MCSFTVIPVIIALLSTLIVLLEASKSPHSYESNHLQHLTYPNKWSSMNVPHYLAEHQQKQQKVQDQDDWRRRRKDNKYDEQYEDDDDDGDDDDDLSLDAFRRKNNAHRRYIDSNGDDDDADGGETVNADDNDENALETLQAAANNETMFVQHDDSACPRDREDATELHGRTCLRKCSSDADCISARKRCLCDGLCGWSCVRPDLACDELNDLSHGKIIMKGNFFNGKVQYECDPGYYLSGVRDRVCQGDSSWSDHPPECKTKAACGPPPVIPHAKHSATDRNLTEFDLNITLQFHCFNGYEVQGTTEATCVYRNGSTNWSGPNMRCNPKKCGDPGEIKHGYKELTGTVFTSAVNYFCNDGFILSGRAVRYCLSNGFWSGDLPSCQPIKCDQPIDPREGRAFFDTFTFGSVVRYECEAGYSLIGPSNRTCGSDRQWSGAEPECKVIDCGHPGPFPNGYIEFRSTNIRSVLQFFCFDGMQFVGNFNQSVCTEKAIWTPHPFPSCMSRCSIPSISNGKVIEHLPMTRVSHGHRINVTCIENFELLHHDQSTSETFSIECYNGTWPELPICVPARCKQLPKKPKNGIVIAPKTNHGMRAVYRCRDGFRLHGPNSTWCNYGSWNVSDMPTCKEIYCVFPGTIESGKVLLVGHMGMYEYRSYVRRVVNNKQILFECEKEHHLEGPPGATCIDGQWSPPQLPTCTRFTYPRLARREIDPRKSREEEALAELQKSDSELKGSRRHRRRRRHPIKSACTSLPERQNMIITVTKRGKMTEQDRPEVYTHRTQISFHCGDGFGLTNVNRTQAKCAKGRWKPEVPECQPLNCLVPAVSGARLRTEKGKKHKLVWIEPDTVLQHNQTLEIVCDARARGQITPNWTAKCQFGTWSPDLRNTSCPDEETIERAPEVYRPPSSDAPSMAPFCQSPEKIENALHYFGELLNKRMQLIGIAQFESEKSLHNSRKDRMAFQYENGTEIIFRCVNYGSIQDYSQKDARRRSTWIIRCEMGNWIGRSFDCEDDSQTSEQTNTKNEIEPAEQPSVQETFCQYGDPGPNVSIFDGQTLITNFSRVFVHDTVLTVRCIDIGRFQLIGPREIFCQNGQWSTDQVPICEGLSQEYNYDLQRSPTIAFRNKFGPIAQTVDGKLLVYPGTILHLECLWKRKHGTPQWSWTHAGRAYQQYWTTEVGRDSSLEFHLTIFHAQERDSGIYTCSTPRSHSHSIEIVVKETNCSSSFQPSNQSNAVRIEMSSQFGDRLNSRINFTCPLGTNLIGSDHAICLPTGNWSFPLPHCQVTECPDLTLSEVLDLPPENDKQARPEVYQAGRKVGDKAIFSCPRGYGLKGGQHEQHCNTNGEWSGIVPYCEEVECRTPHPPERGFLDSVRIDRFLAGDVVQFGCETGFMLVGNPISICQENGRWSGPRSKCVPACTYPGQSYGVRLMSEIKFFYAVNETVKFSCADGYRMDGFDSIKCIDSGRWSGPIPHCEPIKT